MYSCTVLAQSESFTGSVWEIDTVLIHGATPADGSKFTCHGHAHGHAYDHADGVMAGISGPPPGHGSSSL